MPLPFCSAIPLRTRRLRVARDIFGRRSPFRAGGFDGGRLFQPASQHLGPLDPSDSDSSGWRRGAHNRLIRLALPVALRVPSPEARRPCDT